jgi:hypothetical protein
LLNSDRAQVLTGGPLLAAGDEPVESGPAPQRHMRERGGRHFRVRIQPFQSLAAPFPSRSATGASSASGVGAGGASRRGTIDTLAWFLIKSNRVPNISKTIPTFQPATLRRGRARSGRNQGTASTQRRSWNAPAGAASRSPEGDPMAPTRSLRASSPKSRLPAPRARGRR